MTRSGFDEGSGALLEGKIKINWDAESYSCPGATLANERDEILLDFYFGHMLNLAGSIDCLN